MPSSCPAPRALLLDLDGTLVDSVGGLRAAYDDFLASHGAVGSDAEFAGLNGPPLPTVVARLAAAHGLATPVDELLAEYQRRVDAVDGVRPMPGAAALLAVARARGVLCAVVTSNQRARAVGWLAAAGLLGGIALVVGGDDVERGKPTPEPYQVALARLGLRPEQAWAVEDSPAGAASARAAGVTTFVVDGVDARSLIEVALLLDLTPATAPRLEVRPAAALAPTLAARVDAHWDAERAARGPALFEGPLLSLVAVDGDDVRTEAITYRRLIADRRERGVLGEPLVALGVSGVVRDADGRFLLGRRADHVLLYPGAWELAPSGGLEHADWRRHLLLELEEETGLAAAAVRACTPIALSRDRVVGLLEIVASIDVVGERPPVRASAEYPEVAWLTADELAPIVASAPMVPLSRVLLRIFGAPPRWPWPPAG
ncbi:MAG: HAD-IA family hydrolase [Kofleriaceae bacterium]